MTAWSTALLLAVGGEFGFALIAIALATGVIEEQVGQITLAAVLVSMIAGAILIRFNQAIAARLLRTRRGEAEGALERLLDAPERQVVIGGYGRVGHTIAVLLQTSGVPCVVFDTDPRRVAQGRADGHQVMYGDISDPDLLAAIHVERAALVVISVDHPETALRTVSFVAQVSHGDVSSMTAGRRVCRQPVSHETATQGG